MPKRAPQDDVIDPVRSQLAGSVAEAVPVIKSQAPKRLPTAKPEEKLKPPSEKSKRR